MKFGIVLPCWLYNATRYQLALAAFESLARTYKPEEEAKLLIVHRPLNTEAPAFPFDTLVANRKDSAFFTMIARQPDNIGGTEQTLAWGTEQVLADDAVTHVVWMGDDALFNPTWLRRLQLLICRKPDAKAWSVYRSAHIAFHAPLAQDPDDVQVRSICGHGMTFSREEWKEWGIHWSQGQAWPNPNAGDTLDLHHAWARPGERWCTRRSYVEHTGRVGLHCTPSTPEYAIDFVGVA